MSSTRHCATQELLRWCIRNVPPFECGVSINQHQTRMAKNLVAGESAFLNLDVWCGDLLEFYCL
jgi:hypothetical protein